VPAVPTASVPPVPAPTPQQHHNVSKRPEPTPDPDSRSAPTRSARCPTGAELISKPATAGNGVRRAGETANGPSLARGPRLDPIGETANGPSLPEQLAHQMADALTRSHDFDALLHTSLLTLDESGDTPDVAELKRLLKSGIEELIAEHRTLEKNLTDTRRGLQVMTEDRRQMEKALDRARKNSLTDELTGLPNRNAFLRQLDAEIGARGATVFSLALALIDLDDLNTINERYGYAAGDGHPARLRARDHVAVSRL